MSNRNLISVLILVCVLLILHVENSQQSTCQNANCTLVSYLSTLESEIESLSCMKTQFEIVLQVLNASTVQFKTRSKQLEKISSALKLLKDERDILEKSQMVKSQMDNGIVKYLVESPQGRRFSDGTRSFSCNGYRNSTSEYLPDGMYEVELENKTLSVYCDMNTAGGGWTLFATIARDYNGPLFRVFDQTNAGPSSHNSTFHIISRELLERSNYIMAACDDVNNVTETFFTSAWPHSAYCSITAAFRDKINNPLSSADLETTCVKVNGMQIQPTHFTYGRSQYGHSIGFRMGIPMPSNMGGYGHMQQKGWATYSYTTGLLPGEGNVGQSYGLAYHFGGKDGEVYGTDNRNGALFLK